MFARLHAFARRVSTFTGRGRVEARLRDELQLHADLVAAEHLKRGASPEEARRQARLTVGGLAQLREEYRDALGFRPFDDLGRDLRLAVRSLRRSPAFTTVALIVLALGTGAATAVFSVADAVVLRGLPFDQHDRLVAVLEHDTTRATTFGGGSVTPQTFLDWRAEQRSFDGLAAVSLVMLGIRNPEGHPESVRVLRVTAEFFPILRVAPLLGRQFTRDDEVSGRHRVVMLSYGFWQRRFGGAGDVVGKTLALNDEPFDIVGVMPEGFAYPVASQRPTEMYVPMAFRPEDRVRSGPMRLTCTAIGRLRHEVSLARATDDMNRIAAALDAQYPRWGPGRRVRIVTLHERLVGEVRSWLVMLLGAVGLVLLIACVNVANLMLARATARRSEMAVRASLGASRGALVRTLLVESLVLSLAGAAVGVLLARIGVRAIIPWLPASLPRVAGIAIDLRVLGAAILAAVATGAGFGLFPAIHSSRPDLTTALQGSGRSATAGAAGHRLRSALVVAEVALAVVLLVGAGLFIGSFASVMRVDLGFDYRNVLVVSIQPNVPIANYHEALRPRVDLIARLLDALRRVPGVERAAAVSEGLPLAGGLAAGPILIAGRQIGGPDDRIDYRIVTPDYLALLRVPLLHGRHLNDDDRAATQRVAVINDAAARKFWPGQDALGQRFTINGAERVVVGVVGNIRHGGPEDPAREECYLPIAQEPIVGTTLVARTGGDPMNVLPAVKAAIWSVDGDQRIAGAVYTLEEYLDRLIAQRRFSMVLLALFGALGLAISAAGVYGVMAYLVAQRTGEIAVRMALGATPVSVVAMVVRRGGGLVASGLALGGGVSWCISSGVKSFLFQVEPTDPGILTGALLLLALAGLAASVVPARRAAVVDPMAALRQE